MSSRRSVEQGLERHVLAHEQLPDVPTEKRLLGRTALGPAERRREAGTFRAEADRVLRACVSRGGRERETQTGAGAVHAQSLYDPQLHEPRIAAGQQTAASEQRKKEDHYI